MSSPLDGRIRVLAREEAAAFYGDAASGRTFAERASFLEDEVSSLHRLLSLLEVRLNALEKAAGPVLVSARRAARKGVNG